MPLPDQQLTDKQGGFARFVAEGKNHTAAARAAGYAFPDVDGYRLARLPHIQRAIASHVEVELHTGLAPMAWAALRRLLGEEHPGPVQLGAAKAVLQHIAQNAPADARKRALSLMTEEEIQIELDRIQAVRAANAVDITPSLAPIAEPGEG